MRSTEELVVMTKRRIGTHELALHVVCFLVLCIFCSEFVITASADLRGIGKYCRVVVFDRWDTCFLLSGPYITYIAENVKEDCDRTEERPCRSMHQRSRNVKTQAMH